MLFFLVAILDSLSLGFHLCFRVFSVFCFFHFLNGLLQRAKFNNLSPFSVTGHAFCVLNQGHRDFSCSLIGAWCCALYFGHPIQFGLVCDMKEGLRCLFFADVY
jgi:hypothetical protein